MIYDIRNYGAIPDGETLNTKAIQAAVDECHRNGGGRVLISGGNFLTGTIILRNNVNLHLASDGVLLGSRNCADFPERTDLKHVDSAMLPRERNACMIFAEESKNISITGNGTIDCNGESFVEPVVPGSTRAWPFKRIDAPTPPRVVFFTGCRNVTVTDVMMINQPSGWSYWIHDCDYVCFDRVKIEAEVDYPNNDGIHINSSRNVTISNCMITCGDDCIIVRANNSSLTENKVCEKVTVTNCNLTSYSGGIRIGWINDGVIRNCTFSNIVMTDTSVGISILLPGRGEKRISDEGREDTLIEQLSFNNIVMDGMYSAPIYIKIENNKNTRCEAIRNLNFSNVRARGLELPYITGRKGCLLKNITFDNCSFERIDWDNFERRSSHGALAFWDNEYHSFYVKYTEYLVMNNTDITVL